MSTLSLPYDEFKLVYERNAESLHNKAMECYDAAMVQQFNSNLNEALKNYLKSLKYEKQAAFQAKFDDIGEPSTSILFRSAASIAAKVFNLIDAEQKVEYAKHAAELARSGLSENCPHEIASELNDIITKFNTNKYKNYTVRPFSDRDSLKIGHRTEFFYIGTSANAVDLLVHDFESGYAAERIHKGVEILKKVLEKRNLVPDVIIIEHGFKQEDIDFFFQFIIAEPRLSLIPILINGPSISETQLKGLQENPLIDETTNLGSIEPGHLLKKVEFLQQVKKNKPI